ncbi:MAG: fumarylacetoacetate hydrolase family protein [Trebonia sp.]|jgi:2-keto-4-pentenoate hydratase/2-oxohepta-3-ene-1,7-dioic acid hydratase in catechol pathway
MRLANINGTPALAVDDGYIDVAAASASRYDSFDTVFADWAAFRGWAEHTVRHASTPCYPQDMPRGPAVPAPRQVFGVGFNYAAHSHEAAELTGGAKADALPLMFTKFPSSITGPTGQIELPDGRTDFEVELVVAIGVAADRVRVEDAWSHVAGLLVGQDVSARAVQFLGPEQHSIGKSFRTFSPLGPELVTPDEFADPADLELRCWVNGELRQKGRTSEMTYSVAELIALLSAVTTLLPGDVIFTGTPAGVGALEDPPRFLRPGDVVVSEIDGLGRMENRCVTSRPAPDLGTRWHG